MEHNRPVALPGWVVEAIKAKSNGSTAPASAEFQTAATSSPRGLEAVPDIIRGPRDNSGGERQQTLMRYACSLRARSYPWDEAIVLHRFAWHRCEQPPTCTTELTWAEAVGILSDVYSRYLEGGEDERASFDSLVAKEANKIRVREAARELVDAANRPPAEPFDAGTLAEILARPADPPARIEGLIPWDASTLIVAQRKTGKTTLNLNACRSLLLGEDFLGRFPVRPINGEIAYLNFEVAGAQLAHWAADVGIPHDRLYIVNLRGRRNPFSNAEDRQRLAATLKTRGIETIVCDPFGRAYIGKAKTTPEKSEHG